jgi:GGDEF domain-containing protein
VSLRATGTPPVRIGEREIKIAVSVGLCIYPDCHPDCGLGIGELRKNADAPMYGIKDRERNGFPLFAEKLLEPARD